MPGLLGTDQKDPAQTTQDFLGNESPVAFSSQPALPTGGPGAGGGASTAPPTIGGTGVGAPPAAPEGGGGFADLSGAALGGMDQGGSNGEGPDAPGIEGGLGSIPSATTDVGPFSFNASPFGVGVSVPGFGASFGPGGNLSGGVRTGNQTVDSVINTAISALGLPTGFNVPSLIAMLSNSSILGMLASAASAFGAPMAAAQLAHSIALGIPGSTVNMQAAANQADPTGIGVLTQEESAQAAKFGLAASQGPKVGGAQPIGALGSPFENTLQGPQGSAFGLDFSNPSVAQGFAANLAANPAALALAQALGYTGRGVDDPGAGPAGAGVGAGAGPGGGPGGASGGTGGSSSGEGGQGP